MWHIQSKLGLSSVHSLNSRVGDWPIQPCDKNDPLWSLSLRELARWTEVPFPNSAENNFLFSFVGNAVSLPSSGYPSQVADNIYQSAPPPRWSALLRKAEQFQNREPVEGLPLIKSLFLFGTGP